MRTSSTLSFWIATLVGAALVIASGLQARPLPVALGAFSQAPICSVHAGGGAPAPVKQDHASHREACCLAACCAGWMLFPEPVPLAVRFARVVRSARPMQAAAAPSRRLRRYRARAPPA